jgi:hypothetical protein
MTETRAPYRRWPRKPRTDLARLAADMRVQMPSPEALDERKRLAAEQAAHVVTPDMSERIRRGIEGRAGDPNRLVSLLRAGRHQAGLMLRADARDQVGPPDEWIAGFRACAEWALKEAGYPLDEPGGETVGEGRGL